MMMAEPTYSFTIPSIHDDTPLDCRIYHPPPQLPKTTSSNSKRRSSNNNKAAIIAHPYPPLGGSFDDVCVLAVTEALLQRGFIVTTFNFRGAGTSAGKTSWTGRPEVDDLSSVAGLMVYYLSPLLPLHPPPDDDGDDVLSTVISTDDNEPAVISNSSIDPAATQQQQQQHLLLAGYSFGALILSRLPSLPSIIQRFETAEPGTAASEIFLRARTLAKQTRRWQQQQQQSMMEEEASTTTTTTTPRHRGRNLHPSSPPTKVSSLHILSGGEETSPSTRQPSRDSRRSSVEVMREMPHNIKSHMQQHMHIRRHSGQFAAARRSFDKQTSKDPLQSNSVGGGGGGGGNPAVRMRIRYLLISPVLVPLSTTLLSPGLPFTMGSFSSSPSSSDQEEGGGGGGVLSLRHPTLVLFGSSDTFTSSKKLRQWAEKLKREAPDTVCWEQIDGAGHFWREHGVMQALQSEIQEWAQEEAV